MRRMHREEFIQPAIFKLVSIKRCVILLLKLLTLRMLDHSYRGICQYTEPRRESSQP
jgi:hypothetical protein